MEQTDDSGRKAVLIINDLAPHMLNDKIDWILLKECQDTLNVNDCPEIKICWKTRDHRKTIRNADKIKAVPPSMRSLFDQPEKLNDCIYPVFGTTQLATN